MTAGSWERMAEWYDAKQGDTGDFWHRTLATSTWLTERFFQTTKSYRKIEKYREPFAEEIPWDIAPGHIVTTTGYHRPLAWYARTLGDAGLLIRSLDEPQPMQEFLEGSPQGPFIAQIPLHLVLEAVRV